MGSLKVWRADGTLLNSMVVGAKAADAIAPSRITDVTFSPDGQRIAVAQSDGVVTLWQPTSDSAQQHITAHSDWVTAVDFSADGRQLATASRDGRIKLWSAEDGQFITTLAGHRGWVNALSWSPNGQQLASGGEDQRLKLWNVAQGQLAWEVDGHDGESVSAVDFSPDGAWLVSGGGDRTVKRWALAAKAPEILGTHGQPVTAVAFSPDGKSVASAGSDRTVQLWPLEDTHAQSSVARSTMSLEGHGGSVLDLAWRPDGERSHLPVLTKPSDCGKCPHRAAIYAGAIWRAAQPGWKNTGRNRLAR
ncbi:MAG: hypothetical protein HC800_01240 [Phormidesmis sp. RL_2_1]|nr:hypothetical protein [Phormidesmis sp. RL_2_1]